ncbi:MAG: EI24 domain-containing protein, partial [Roseobacter sp.]
MIITSFFAAVRQLTDPRFRKVLLMGIGITLLTLIGISVAFVWLVGVLIGDTTTLPFIGEVTWLDNVAGWGSAVVLALLSVFLMVPVASAITSMFLDTV